MTVHLVTFSDESMSRSRARCVASGDMQGITDSGFCWTWANLADTRELWTSLASPEKARGIGYWAWKPFVIYLALETLTEGSIIVYADAGIEFINNVNYIIDRMDQDIFLFGNMWEHAHWCKRDIIEAVWPAESLPSGHYGLVDYIRTDEKKMWGRFSKQVQASVIFFRVSDYSKRLVKEWLDWCLFEGGRLIDDSPSRTPNHPEFQENRHDQAILTTLAYREGIKLHWWPAQYNDGAFVYERGVYPDEGYPVLFNHHRKRNHEWSNAA